MYFSLHAVNEVTETSNMSASEVTIYKGQTSGIRTERMALFSLGFWDLLLFKVTNGFYSLSNPELVSLFSLL
jgi:hypothetical protein